jgi:hypothetical protein
MTWFPKLTRHSKMSNRTVVILDFRLSDHKLGDRIQVFARIRFSPQSKIGNLKSKILSDDPVRPRQYIRRNHEVDLLGGLQIDHEFKFRWLLNGKVLGLCSF